MNKSLFPLAAPLLATLVAVPSYAATPQVVVDPAAKTLLDEATSKYKAAKGVKFNLLVNENQKEKRYKVAFQKPNLFHIEINKGGAASKFISDGTTSYSVEKATYKKSAVLAQGSSPWLQVVGSGTSYLMSGMLEGRSPIVEMQTLLKSAPMSNARMTFSVPPPAVVDGVALNGVKINIAGEGKPTAATNIYIWFDSDGLLRRVSTNDTSSNRNYKSTEQISDQQLDSTFAADTFKFNTVGMKPAADETEDEAFYDPRLKVGAMPFAFTARDMKGQPISLDKYKGKVLLLDFWATWCGPCVAAFPELKSTYTKYHPQGLEVVSISLDQDKKALTSFISARKAVWPQVFDGKGWSAALAKQYGVKAIPFMMVVGKDGKIAALEPEGHLDTTIKTALAAK